VTAAAPADALGLEGRVAADDHQSLKLWLRLLACSTEIERTIARRLRQEEGITLPRFDVMAQLHRHPEGLTMSALSRYLMVTAGNTTGLIAELEKDGLVARTVEPHDRRSSRVTLTPRGRRRFDRLAATHEAWVVELLGGLPLGDQRRLHALLGALRATLRDTAGERTDAVASAPVPTPARRRARRTGAAA
jgi:DNA-binding MarR family transcriptional regulator